MHVTAITPLFTIYEFYVTFYIRRETLSRNTSIMRNSSLQLEVLFEEEYLFPLNLLAFCCFVATVVQSRQCTCWWRQPPLGLAAQAPPMAPPSAQVSPCTAVGCPVCPPTPRCACIQTTSPSSPPWQSRCCVITPRSPLYVRYKEFCHVLSGRTVIHTPRIR